MATLWNELNVVDLDIPDYRITICCNNDNDKEFCYSVGKEGFNEEIQSQPFTPPNMLKDKNLDFIIFECVKVFGVTDEEKPYLLKKISALNINFNEYIKVETNELVLPKDPFKLTSDAVALKVISEPLLIKQLLNSYLSAFTNNPLNIAITGPSGEGKTYPALNTIKLFPKRDVMIYAGASPKSFIHDNGILVNSEFKPIEANIKELEDKIYDLKYSKDYEPKELAELRKNLTDKINELKRDTKTLIDFENKILLLLDAPPKDLWDNMKTLLSHDQYHLEFKFVNNDKGIKTESVVFKGFPAFVVASARDESKWDVWEEIKTRVMVINPDMDEEKYKKVFGFIAKAYENPWQVFEAKEEHKLEKEAKQTIKTLKKLMLKERDNMRGMTNDHDESDEQLVWIPYAHLIADNYKADKGARQREIKQFMQNITMSAWWNAPNRAFLIRRDEGRKYRFVIATPEDFYNTEQIFRTQGIGDFKLEFYHNIFFPCYMEAKIKHKNLEDDNKILYPFPGITTTELTKYWNKIKGSETSADNIRKTYLNELEKEGFIEDLGIDVKLHKQKHWYKRITKGKVLNIDSSNKPLLSPIAVDLGIHLTNGGYIDLIKPLLENHENVELETYQGKPMSVKEMLNFMNIDIKSLGTVHIQGGNNNRNRHDDINNNTTSSSGSITPIHTHLDNQGLNKPHLDESSGLSKTLPLNKRKENIERQEKLIELGKKFSDDEETLKMELMMEFNYNLDMATQDINTLRLGGVIPNK